VEGAVRRVVVVGAGIFGITAAYTLRQRGWHVVVVDPGPVPHPDAASTDVSKVVRMDYGADDFYMDLMREALVRWDIWNNAWPERPWHEDGFLLLTRQPMAPGGFEHESFVRLVERGYRPERGVPSPWPRDVYVDGYLDRRAGWAESGTVVAILARKCREIGVELREGTRLSGLLDRGSRVAGVILGDGTSIEADAVVVAAGTWTPVLLPWLSDRMWSVGQPVLHFQVADPAPWQPPRFTPWAADIGTTGWYGFPALPDGRIKVANHGPGRRVHPDEPRVVDPDAESRFRAFLRESLPALADAPLVHTRLCLYCDTFDGDFWIDRDPDRDGLVVAAGGSGHAFKFAPVLGGLVANVVEGRPDPRRERFRWRPLATRSTEDARSS
jgi:glycine/D-amino acid oxidase-like deaminating enzyme